MFKFEWYGFLNFIIYRNTSDVTEFQKLTGLNSFSTIANILSIVLAPRYSDSIRKTKSCFFLKKLEPRMSNQLETYRNTETLCCCEQSVYIRTFFIVKKLFGALQHVTKREICQCRHGGRQIFCLKGLFKVLFYWMLYKK